MIEQSLMVHFLWLEFNFGLWDLIPKPLNLRHLWHKIGGIYKIWGSLCSHNVVVYIENRYWDLSSVTQCSMRLQHLTHRSEAAAYFLGLHFGTIQSQFEQPHQFWQMKINNNGSCQKSSENPAKYFNLGSQDLKFRILFQ